MTWWKCPNEPPCPHGGGLHDVHDLDDPIPTCCVDDCRCGHPGTATVQRNDDGTLTVLQADPVIRVTRDLLTSLALGPDDVLQLDTAGRYRYRYIRPAEQGDSIYARVGQ